MLDHSGSYYSTNDSGGAEFLWFYENVLAEALAKTGAIFSDPENAWMFFVDAPAGCNQLSGGGTSGIAIMDHNDFRGLVGNEFWDACTVQPNPSFTFTPQRWIGGQGHELGHVYGLPHPPGCDKGLPECDQDALMWAGFFTGFPDDTYLREEEKSHLISGSYVTDKMFSDGFE